MSSAHAYLAGLRKALRDCLKSGVKDPKGFLRVSSSSDKAAFLSRVRRLPGSKTFRVWIFKQSLSLPVNGEQADANEHPMPRDFDRRFAFSRPG
jgi:hypothetical protein